MPTVVAQLAIMLDDAGNVAVNGPLNNRMLCMGMLEMAKDAIHKQAEKNQRLIAEVPPGTRLREV